MSYSSYTQFLEYIENTYSLDQQQTIENITIYYHKLFNNIITDNDLCGFDMILRKDTTGSLQIEAKHAVELLQKVGNPVLRKRKTD
jgi:hypothetical protein